METAYQPGSIGTDFCMRNRLSSPSSHCYFFFFFLSFVLKLHPNKEKGRMKDGENRKDHEG